MLTTTTEAARRVLSRYAVIPERAYFEVAQAVLEAARLDASRAFMDSERRAMAEDAARRQEK